MAFAAARMIKDKKEAEQKQKRHEEELQSHFSQNKVDFIGFK